MKQEVKDILFIRTLNALVVAGIALFSSLSVHFPPDLSNIYASLIAFALTFLVQLKPISEELDQIAGKELQELKQSGKSISADTEKEEDEDKKKNNKSGNKFLMLL